MPEPKAIRLRPPARLDAVVRPPGSKSLTNRALIAAGLAAGPCDILNASLSDDAKLLAGALARFGHEIRIDPDARTVSVTPREHYPEADRRSFYLGGAGTAVRFFISFLCVHKGKFLVDGDPRMRERPVADLLDALGRLGANVRSVLGKGTPPVAVDADGIRGGRAWIRADVSSQFVSSILLASPRFERGLDLRLEGPPTSEPYLDMTVQVMEDFGVRVERAEQVFRVAPGQAYRPTRFPVEPDASGAGYFLAMAAATGGRVRIDGLGRRSVQGDVRFAELLGRMGCRIETGADAIVCEGGPLKGLDVDMNSMPDSVQTLAALALFAEGTTRVRNVANLRLKETDRIGALGRELAKLGATVRELEDGLEIEPPDRVRPARIATYGDHRMAMSFAVAAARVPGIEIEEPGVADKSFPEFFELLQRIGFAVEPAEGPKNTT